MPTFAEMLRTFTDPRLLHAAMVHFPVAMSWIAVPFALALALSRRPRPALRRLVVGFYLLLLLAALLAVRSGLDARGEIGAASSAARLIVAHHEWLAGRVWLLASLTLAAALADGWRRPLLSKIARILCALGAVACAGWIGLVAHHGGTAVYLHGVGVRPTPESLQDERAFDAATEHADPRTDHFERSVRPLLAGSCQGCHGSGEDAAGGLDLASIRGILRGGGRGPALVPGDPDSSLLYQTISGARPTLRMPLGREPLTDDEIQDIREWIAAGAIWVEDSGAERELSVPGKLIPGRSAGKPAAGRDTPDR